MIDPATGATSVTIALDGKPEEAVSRGNGLLFVNIEDKAAIARANLKTLKVEANWPLAPAEGPTGLAYDPATGRLFAGCV